MKKALVIIDVQNDYFSNGKMELYQPEAALNVIKELIKQFRESNLPIYYVQHISPKGAPFFEPDTEGVNLHKDLKPLATEKVIVKHYPNSFFETDLQAELQKDSVTDLVICGMMTHMCVDTTLRAARDYGYSTTLISDACATKDLEWNGEIIPADTVQKVYMASLNQTFADVI